MSLLDIHSRKNCINLYGKFETDGNHRVEGIEKMKVAKLFSGIADILIAYCVGHCSLLGTAPFGTAIIVRQRLREKSVDVAARIARRIF